MGYWLWVNLIQRAEPRRGEVLLRCLAATPLVLDGVLNTQALRQVRLRAVAVQVAFERANFVQKPVFHLIGARVAVGSPGGFQAMGQLDSTCIQPPP